MHTPRFIVNDNAREKYSVRGVVVEHGVHEYGRWIFKKRVPFIRVRINEDHLSAFNQIAHSHMRTPDNLPISGIPSTITVTMDTEEETREYPDGAEVGITFGYADPMSQLGTRGAASLKMMALRVMSPGVQLDDEILAPA